MHVLYLCWPNGWSLHNVGLSLAPALLPHGVRVDVVDSREWFARPTPADAVCLAHTSFYWPGFPYRDHVREVFAVVHDPDEVSTFTDRFAWRDEPLHHLPVLRAFDRVLTCSREMVDVLRGRYGVPVWHAATYPHNAAALLAARAPATAPRAGAPVRFVSTALGPGRVPWARVLARARSPLFWATDERGRFSPRQLRSAAVRVHRKNVPWLERLERALAAEPRAAADFRYGARHTQLGEAEYLARLAGADVYVCTSYMEGGPLPVMEAVLAGLAVITTPVGQTAEWVRDGENAFVCRTYAEVERAARCYAADPGLLRAHRARSRAVAAGKAFDAAGWAAFLRGAR
ncbi:hypothetical protein tb265_10290 [Gemmatimonadetes bacterium T265]|nr:hypothetical protein tb265_10290 [Gemmatimonadetes bacterium T265]